MTQIKQPIVGVERAHNGHRAIYLEKLACGHTGQGRSSPEAILKDLAAGRQRVCFRCTHQR